jgi:hypothetical protein
MATSRKDYYAAAAALAKVAPPTAPVGAERIPEDRATWLRCVDAIADVFEADNERFDRERFYVACGVVR